MYSFPAMTTEIEIEMTVEKLDFNGDTIAEIPVFITATYSADKGDYLTPPYESMEIDSVIEQDGTDYKLDRWEEKMAITLLYEELKSRAERCDD